jgi:serine/threonine protein kinase
MMTTHPERISTRDTIGKYRLIKKLGRGGMGTVYLGYDPAFGQGVAIKVAHLEQLLCPKNNEIYKRLFFNEAMTAWFLNHPNIIAVFDTGIEGDIYYIVTEYVPGGQTLKDFCSADKLLPLKEATTLIYKCAMALDYAHKKGVIHRDIKPKNILLTPEKDIKIGDFGIAMHVDEGPSEGTKYAGSPLYMSPEQIQGEKLSTQSDLFSLGIVMYELLTGRRPFAAQNLDSIRQLILEAKPPPLSSHRADLPKVLEMVVEKMLAKNLSHRYMTGLDLAGDLSVLLDALKSQDQRIETLRQERFRIAEQSPFFKGLAGTNLWELINASLWQDLRVGQEIFLSTEHKSFYLVISGTVSILKEGQRIGLLTAGDCFGEMEATERSKTTSMRAITNTTLMTFRAPSIEHASVNNQLWFYKLFTHTLLERLSRPVEPLAIIEGQANTSRSEQAVEPLRAQK